MDIKYIIIIILLFGLLSLIFLYNQIKYTCPKSNTIVNKIYKLTYNNVDSIDKYKIKCYISEIKKMNDRLKLIDIEIKENDTFENQKNIIKNFIKELKNDKNKKTIEQDKKIKDKKKIEENKFFKLIKYLDVESIDNFSRKKLTKYIILFDENSIINTDISIDIDQIKAINIDKLRQKFKDAVNKFQMNLKGQGSIGMWEFIHSFWTGSIYIKSSKLNNSLKKKPDQDIESNIKLWSPIHQLIKLLLIFYIIIDKIFYQNIANYYPYLISLLISNSYTLYNKYDNFGLNYYSGGYGIVKFFADIIGYHHT